VPNPPEALAKLPQLKVSDLPRKAAHIPTSIGKLPHGLDLLRTTFFSNGVSYLALECDMPTFPPSLYEFIPRWTTPSGSSARPGSRSRNRRAPRRRHRRARRGPMLYAHATGPVAEDARHPLLAQDLDGQIEPALGSAARLALSESSRDARSMSFVACAIVVGSDRRAGAAASRAPCSWRWSRHAPASRRGVTTCCIGCRSSALIESVPAASMARVDDHRRAGAAVRAVDFKEQVAQQSSAGSICPSSVLSEKRIRASSATGRSRARRASAPRRARR